MFISYFQKKTNKKRTQSKLIRQLKGRKIDRKLLMILKKRTNIRIGKKYYSVYSYFFLFTLPLFVSSSIQLFAT